MLKTFLFIFPKLKRECMQYNKFQKIISGFLIFFLLFSFTIRVPFLNFFLPSSFALDTPYYNIVSIFVEEDIYNDLKSNVRRYARDIEWVLENTRVVILPTPSDVSAFQIASLNESLYFEWYKSVAPVNFESKLIGSVFVGNFSLPLVFDGQSFSTSVFPFVDFEDKGYIYNHETEVYEKDAQNASDMKAEIWHGFITPNTGDKKEDIKKINDYFDKNHDFYEGKGLFDTSLWVMSWNEDDVINDDYEPYVFYYDQFRENNAVNYANYKGYLAYYNNLEDIIYKRFSKELADKLKEALESWQNEEIDELAKKLGLESLFSQETSLDLTQSSDILSRYVTNASIKNFIEVFNEGTISDFRTLVHNAGRYNGSWGEVNVDLIPFLITVLDTISTQIVKDSNTKLENHIDAIITNNARKIALPVSIKSDESIWSLGGSCGTTYLNILYWKEAKDITEASECSIYRGSLTNSWNLVEANRGYNIDKASDDINKCSSDRDRDGHPDTEWYWWWNSPLNLDGESVSSWIFTLNRNYLNRSLEPLFDIAWAREEDDITKIPSPLQCYDNNFILAEKKSSSFLTCRVDYRIPNLGSAVNWNCATDNKVYDYNESFEEFYNRFDSISIPECSRYKIILDGKTIKEKENTYEFILWVRTLCSKIDETIYTYKSISSPIVHKSPTSDELSSQVNAMLTPSLPIDTIRYIDYIAPDWSYKRFDYPKLFSLSPNGNDTLDSYKQKLESLLDEASTRFNTITKQTAPTTLSWDEKTFYNLLSSWEYQNENIDLYDYLVSQTEDTYTNSWESKDNSYFDMLVFSLYWKNMTNISAKYKFVFENYLSDEFGVNTFGFHLPKNKKSYEIAYLWAPWDANNMYIKLDPEEKWENPYADIIAQNIALNTSLFSYNLTESWDTATNNWDEMFKCAPPDGVNIWEWIPAVICRLEDMLPPTIKISDGDCWTSLLSEEEIEEYNECNGDINKNAINDCIEKSLSAWSLSLEADTNRYYYNTSWKLIATLLDDEQEVVNFDNSTNIQFRLNKIVAPENKEETFSSSNSKVVYDALSETEETRKLIADYINFKDISVRSNGWSAGLIFSTKNKDADFYFEALVEIKNNNDEGEISLNSQEIKVEVRGDRLFITSSVIENNEDDFLVFSWENSVKASNEDNLYIVNDTDFSLANEATMIYNNSLASEKLIFSLSNFSKEGQSLALNYPLSYTIKSWEELIQEWPINDSSLSSFSSLGSFNKTGKYTLTLIDSFWYSASKNFSILPSEAKRVNIELGSNVIEEGGVITTNIFSLFDDYDNPAVWDVYRVEAEIEGAWLQFYENGEKSIHFNIVDAYRAFRLESTNNSWNNTIHFHIFNDLGEEIFSETVQVRVVEKIRLFLTPLFSEIKVGWGEYHYKLQAQDESGNILSGFNSRAYFFIDSLYWTTKENYFPLISGQSEIAFNTTNNAWENVAIEFQIEGAKTIKKGTIDILPEKPVKIDIELSKSKMQASSDDDSTVSVVLKDRYGNTVFTDNETKFLIEVDDKYASIIQFDATEKIAQKWRQSFQVSGTDMPWKAYFKVSVDPSLLWNSFQIPWQSPFPKQELRLSFLKDGTGLSAIWKAFLSENDSETYIFKYSSLSWLQGNDIYATLSAGEKQILTNFWEEKNVITITPVSENAWSIETFYFWNKEAIDGNAYNVLYTTLLWADYGNIREKDYLASALLFDKDNRSLAVSSLLNRPYIYRDVLSLKSNGAIQKVYGSNDLTQDIKTRVSADRESGIKISLENTVLGSYIGDMYMRFNEDNLYLNTCLDDCEFSQKDTSVLLSSQNETYDAQYSWGRLLLVNQLGQDVLRVDKTWKIEKNANIYFVLSEQAGKQTNILIKTGEQTIGVLHINFIDAKVAKTRDATLLENYKSSLKNSIIFFLNSNLYSLREIYDGSEYNYFLHYIDPFDGDLTLDSFSNNSKTIYENFYKEGWLGWEWWNKILLSFASWDSVWEATKDYQSFWLINLGDPVLFLQKIKKDLPWTTEERSFDTTIWELLIKDDTMLDYRTLDFNNDKHDDIVVFQDDGYLSLYKNEFAEENFRSLGHLVYLPDSVWKAVFETWDFTGDGYDDIFIINDSGEPILINNHEKDFYRFDITDYFSLSGSILQIESFDMDNDGRDDIVTLDDSWEIHIFYGGGTSEKPRFTQKLVGNGYGLELSDTVRSDGAIIYFDSLYQIDDEQYNTDILTSNDLYIEQIQSNISWDTQDTINFNERYFDGIFFENISYTPISQRGENPNIGSINNSEISDDYNNTSLLLEDFINQNGNNISSSTYTNANKETTFIKSEYAHIEWLEVKKQYNDLNGETLKRGDEIQVTVTLTNTSSHNLRDIAYVEDIPNVFSLNEEKEMISDNNLTPLVAPSGYDFLVEDFSLYPWESTEFSYFLTTNSYSFWYIDVGLFEAWESWDDDYGDILLKEREENCGQEADIYRSIASRDYEKWIKATQCDETRVDPDYADTDGNNVPDYIDRLIEDEDARVEFSEDARNTLLIDSDGDGIPDDEEALDDYNDEEGLSSFDSLSEAVDDISEQMDTIIEWFWCWFWGGACFASPLNWAPLAPWNDPTLMGMPIGDGLRVNEGMPVFSALTGLQMMCGTSPCCIPVVYPVSPLAYVPWPKCWKPSAWGYLGTWAPSNYVRLFVTPTLTWWVGTAICYGWPAQATWLANPPWVHPLVPWGNCVVVAMPLLGCEDDGSDGDIETQWFSQTSFVSDYDIIAGNCSSDSYVSSSDGDSGDAFDDTFVKEYINYKETWTASQSFEDKLEEVFSTVAKNNNSRGQVGFNNSALITLEWGWGDDMTASLDIDFRDIASWNFDDVIEFNMERVFPFPDFVMEWVTRQIEEIVTKLTDFPTLFIILPDFSGIMDSGWGNFTQWVGEAFEKGKQEKQEKNEVIENQIKALNTKKAWLNCAWDDAVACSIIERKKSNLQSKKITGNETISWIHEVYQFLSQMPLIELSPETISVSIPRIDETTLNKTILDWKATKADWSEEINEKTQARSLWATCNQRTESEKQACKEENEIKQKASLQANTLLKSLEKNISILEDYKNIPKDLNDLVSKKEERLDQVLCNLENISSFMGGRISKNGKRFKAWIELYVLIRAILKSWQLLVDLFIDYEASCHQCKNERDDLLYFAFKLIDSVIPKIPVIQFPKWPDIILDLHNIRVGMTIYIPELQINLRPMVLPTLPDFSLPDIPNAHLNIGDLPILPWFELLELPDLPSLPSVELPDLPPPPKIPKLFSSLEGIIDVLKLITKAMCILKTNPFVPEWRAWDQIAFITERNGYLPTDFLDISLPQFSYPFVDAIKVTTYVNFEFDSEFLVESVRQALFPLNSMTSDVLNMMKWNIEDIDFSNYTPEDIHGDVDLHGSASEIQEKIIYHIADSLFENIFRFVAYLDENKGEMASIDEMKKLFASEIQKESIVKDTKLDSLRWIWETALSYDFAEEDALIEQLQKDNKEKFESLKKSIEQEKEATKKQKESLQEQFTPFQFKNISLTQTENIFSKEQIINSQNKFIESALKVADGKDPILEEIQKDGSDFVNYVQNKILAANIDIGTTGTVSNNTSAFSSQATCNLTWAKGQEYDYEWLYVVEQWISYRLFDYTDQLEWDEEVQVIDFDRDGDDDLLYRIKGEIFLKKNLKNKNDKMHLDDGWVVLFPSQNKFFNGDVFYEAINGAKEAEVSNGYINFAFDAPTNPQVDAFRLEFYTRVDKSTQEGNNGYTPEWIKKHIIDAFVDDKNTLFDEETNDYMTYYSLWRISSIGELPWVILETKSFQNIEEILEETGKVNISSTSTLYTAQSWVRIEYQVSWTDTINHTYIEKFHSIQFKEPITIITIDWPLYRIGGESTRYEGQDILRFVGMPLLPDTKIFVEDDQRVYNERNHLDITYYDNSTLALDLQTIESYEVYNLGFTSNHYLIRTQKPNDFYYARIMAFKDGIFGTKSKQILLSPQKEADVYPPEINISWTIRLPVYQKKTFDFTESIYEPEWITAINDFFIDFNLEIDSDGDGDPKNDRDMENISIQKTLNALRVSFGPYDSLFKKKIGIWASDMNDNTAYKEIVFEVYSPTPNITGMEEGTILWVLDERLQEEPVNIYRYRGGIISKILDVNDGEKVLTYSWWIYDFEAEKLIEGDGVAIEYNGTKIATIDEYTGYIHLTPWLYSVFVSPASDESPYIQVHIMQGNQELYVQEIRLSKERQVQVVDSFEWQTSPWIYLTFSDKNNYSYYQIPLGAPINPWALVIYSLDSWRSDAIFTLLQDGRIFTKNAQYSLGYNEYDGNIVFTLNDRINKQEIARVMFVLDGNFIIE